MIIAATALLASGYAVANGPAGSKGEFTIDTKQSKVVWTGKKVTGEHTGTLMLKDGSVSVNDGAVTAAKVNMDMTSITCTDLEDKEYNQKLIGHLKSPDFFSVEENPTANFKTTSFKAMKSTSKDGSNYTVTGDLTIKGITHSISFPAKVSVNGDKLTANATATFDRSKWEIKYGSSSFFEGLGDKVIYDDVEFEFQLVATTK